MSDLYPWLESLRAELSANPAQLPHALLLHGPQGIGKYALATTLAETLLCVKPKPAEACGHCSACLWLAAGNHPDFRVVRPDSERAEGEFADPDGVPAKKPKKKIPIEAVRELVTMLALTAHRSRRIIIIEPAETMTRDAANALLKTLEEPPAYTLFILVSHRPGKLLPTLRSRCRLIAVAGPAADDGAAWLARQNVDQPVERLAHSGGAPLLALKEATSDQDALREAVIEALASGPDIPALALAERIAKAPPPDALRWLQCWAHDLIAQKVADTCRYNIDRVAQLQRLAAQVALPVLLRYQRGLTDAAWLVEHPLNMQLYFEQQLIGYAALFTRESAYV